MKERINNFFPSLTESEKKIKKIEQHKMAEGKVKTEEKNILEKINDAKKLLLNVFCDGKIKVKD